MLLLTRHRRKHYTSLLLSEGVRFFFGGGGLLESQSCCHACCCGLSDFERNRITPRFVGGSAHETRLLALHQKNSSRCFCLKLHLPRTRCGLRLFPSSFYSSRSFFFFRRYSCLVFTAASLFLVKLSRRFLSQFATEATRIRLVFLCVPFFFSSVSVWLCSTH